MSCRHQPQHANAHDEIAARMAEAGHFHPAAKAHPSYPLVADSYHCLCGDMVRGWIPDDRLTETHLVAPHLYVRRERAILAPLSNYQEARIVFDDGSAHITFACRDCLQNIADLRVAEQLYMRDLARFQELEKLGHPTPSDLWRRYAFRHPVRLELIGEGEV